MITVRVDGHESYRVRNTASAECDEVIHPNQERSFTEIIDGVFIVERIQAVRVDPRFHAAGGDPYNRVGRLAV